MLGPKGRWFESAGKRVDEPQLPTSQSQQKHPGYRVVRSGITIIAKISAAIIGFLTIYAFFAVKPLPRVDLDLDLRVGEYGCQTHYVDEDDRYRYDSKGLAGLVDHVGQVVFVNIEVHADLSFERSEETDEGTDSEVDQACFLDMSDEAASAGGWSDENPHNLTAIASLPLDDRSSGYSYDAVNIYAPRETAPFLQLGVCEGHCYSLRGAVRADEVANSEGIMDINLIPVDVYANSYLTSRYECSLQAENMLFPRLAAILCSF